ncbi:MAG TPA: TIGR03118 family protein [Candidatus Acidoferrum sp.]|nr:TIGR03118 family protein [Candidatus Acidoferrum sp.]
MKLLGQLLRVNFLLILTPMLSPGAVFAQHYTQTNLVSDIVGAAATHDGNLQNPWGLTRSSTGPWWVSDNNSGVSTLYTGAGTIIPINGNGIVTIPPPKNAPAGFVAAPTGIVFNDSTSFVIPAPNGNPAAFIFVTEDGTISAWNGGASAVLIVDNNDNGSANGAVYKGATSADLNGAKYLYVTNFRDARVEVYDSNFNRVKLSDDAFDPGGDGDHDGDDSRSAQHVPRGFAPFNIQNIGGSLFVTYAKQNASRHDNLTGDGEGFVEIFTPAGKHIGHLERGPWLNAPWGVVWTPRDFGVFSNSILVGNFGSGWVAAFNGFTHKFIGFVQNPDNSLLTIDGLWSLTFGNDGKAGPATTLFFSAGPNQEHDGLFGTLTPVAAENDGSVE